MFVCAIHCCYPYKSFQNNSLIRFLVSFVVDNEAVNKVLEQRFNLSPDQTLVYRCLIHHKSHTHGWKEILYSSAVICSQMNLRNEEITIL